MTPFLNDHDRLRKQTPHHRLSLPRVLRYDLEDENSVEAAFYRYQLVAFILAFPIVFIIALALIEFGLGGK